MGIVGGRRTLDLGFRAAPGVAAEGARGDGRRWPVSLRRVSPDLLRQLRAEAGLTQEELAEAAGLSPRTVSDLERGIHRAAQQAHCPAAG